ncbi:MAG TPA: acyl-ACP--UDP-N-acetylglucosamine O-acyltransferase [Gammaproteobacteria bacterium]|nr:acyl-ACP--UDP-N-acetylglucosamine O-acyltransferase [Gammaproteobacteria bacterium]
MIDARAIVSPRARLDADVQVGPYAIIGDDVEIGRGTRVEAHAVIKGPTVIGEDNRIFQFTSLGDDPQDKKYAGEPTRLVIGNRNTIREYVTINRGTVQDLGETRIGDDNWIMAYVHIAHDCVVGNQTIFANAATLAGHVHVGDYAFLGGFTGAHQFCRIGPHALISMYSYIKKDVPAYVLCDGQPAEPRGINVEGLKRRGFTAEQQRNIREAYRLVYRQGLKLEEAVALLAQRTGEQPELVPMLESLRGSARGLIR